MLMLIEYLPEFMQEFKEMKIIMDTIQPFVNDISRNITKLLSDMFFLESSESGLSRYENMLNIEVKPTDDLEDRRYRVYLRYNETLPYTYRSLVKLLNSICGEDGYELYISYDDFTLDLKLMLKNKNMVELLMETLDEIVPVNMVLNIEILYNTWGVLKNYNWKSLDNKTWLELRESDLSEAN